MPVATSTRRWPSPKRYAPGPSAATCWLTAELERLPNDPEEAFRLAALVIASGTGFEVAVSAAQAVIDKAAPLLPPEQIAAIWQEATPEAFEEVISGLLTTRNTARTSLPAR